MLWVLGRNIFHLLFFQIKLLFYFVSGIPMMSGFTRGPGIIPGFARGPGFAPPMFSSYPFGARPFF